MKSDSVKWGPSPGLGSVIFPNRPVTADNRVTAMKLKDRALTGKPQHSRNARINLKSAPPFQKRTLDSFPMPHDYKDVVRFVHSHRREVKDAQDRMTRKRLDSASLREYSRQMFDTACAKTPLQSEWNLGRSRQVVSTCTVLSQCNSDKPHTSHKATVAGSTLYNIRQQVFNSHHVCPYSETVIKYNHERGKTVAPAIREAITRSSEEFRIVPSAASSRSTSMSSLSMCENFVFVRKTKVKDTEANSFTIPCTNCLALSNALLNADENFDEKVNREVAPDEARPTTRLMPPDTKEVLHIYIVSLEEDSPSESESDITKVVDAAPEQRQRLPLDEPKSESPSKSLGKKSPEKPKSGKSRPKSGRVKSAKGGKKGISGGKTKKQNEEEPIPPPPEQEAEVKPVEVKKPLRGPHCWVDDVSVTSEHPTNLDVLNTNGTQVTVKGQESKVDPQNEFAVLTVNSNVKDTQVEGRKRVETSLLAQTKDKEEFRLPDFICSTSERKSKEVAVKDWLANTNFRYANRCVPML